MNRFIALFIPSFLALLVSVPAFAGSIVKINVPEPASLALVAAGVGGVALYRRLRK